MFDILYLGFELFRCVGKEQVIAPAGGLDENFSAVDLIASMSLLVKVILNPADSKSSLTFITNLTVQGKFKAQIIQARLANFIGPP